MENQRPKISSGDKFSFPIFEFDLAGTTDHLGSPISPADRFFFNGRLLPHAFPCQPTNGAVSFSRSTSRTSSVSSKDSFLSSRSNSGNSSRSSSCSSARTSTSTEAKFPSKIAGGCGSTDWYRANKKPVLVPHYGSSQRWQFIVTPPLSHQGSSRTRKVDRNGERGEKLKSNNNKSKPPKKKSTWLGWRFLRSFVSTCKECHAI
ncbi:hypothetical protein M9H77_21847 [Catharanthus roseus]|uniref:Uncharacterized protein n=1 Tax=Catharanthus roseus TaxID=4058 RepID=A0ACC0APM4_CATRO|nr:hypothetical protein M9H77_21847 [Catharanthus roseus]